MKIMVVQTVLAFLFTWSVAAQNIVNKLGTGGVFTIKDATNTFFTLRQADRRVGIGTTTPNNLLQVANLISFDSVRFSTALGYMALSSNTGIYNVATGDHALFSNTGNSNTAIGASALYSNTTGPYNTASGSGALALNTTGEYNTASGSSALYLNTHGGSNTAVGSLALYNNVESYNTGFGSEALFGTTAAQYNVAVGFNAGSSRNNGYNNVFVGANTDANQDNLFNVIAVGQGTIVTASSTARFGNSSTISYGGWAGWSNVSDARFKKNVRENVPGLDFILKLRPITYNLDAIGMETFLHKNDRFNPKAEHATLSMPATQIQNKALLEKERILQTGFVAQEVEAAAQELGYDFSGVDKPKSENDYYGLRYAEFVVPLVKAVQEQQTLISALQKKIEELNAMVKAYGQAQKKSTPVNR